MGEFGELLQRLDSGREADRLLGVEGLRSLLRSGGGRLAGANLSKLFHSLKLRLQDESWNVIHQSTQLIDEAVDGLGGELGTLAKIVLPVLVENLADGKILIRKESLNTLSHLIKAAQMQAVLGALVRYGLLSSETRVRQESALSVPILVTKRQSSFVDFSPLLQALVGRLQDSSDDVIEASEQALYHLQMELQSDFKAQMAKLSPEDVRTFQEHQSHMAAAGRTALNPGATGASRDAGEYEKENIEGRISSHDSVASLSSGGSRGASGKKDSGDKVFGLVPASVIADLDNMDAYQTRAEALEKLKYALAHTEDMREVIPHLSPLVRLLTGPLLHDTNFTVSVSTLEILSNLVNKVGFQINAHIPGLLVSLCNMFGDTKVVIRTTLMGVMMRLMQIVTPKPILGQLMKQLGHKSWRVRAEVLDILIAMLLKFPEYDFDYLKLVAGMGKLLTDPHERVRSMTMEALAVVQYQWPAGDVLQILESRVEREALRDLERRFEDPSIAYIGKNGSVEHPAVPSSPRRIRSARVRRPSTAKSVQSQLFDSQGPDNGPLRDAEEEEEPQPDESMRPRHKRSSSAPVRDRNKTLRPKTPKKLPWDQLSSRAPARPPSEMTNAPTRVRGAPPSTSGRRTVDDGRRAMDFFEDGDYPTSPVVGSKGEPTFRSDVRDSDDFQRVELPDLRPANRRPPSLDHLWPNPAGSSARPILSPTQGSNGADSRMSSPSEGDNPAVQRRVGSARVRGGAGVTFRDTVAVHSYTEHEPSPRGEGDAMAAAPARGGGLPRGRSDVVAGRPSTASGSANVHHGPASEGGRVIPRDAGPPPRLPPSRDGRLARPASATGAVRLAPMGAPVGSDMGPPPSRSGRDRAGSTSSAGSSVEGGTRARGGPTPRGGGGAGGYDGESLMSARGGGSSESLVGREAQEAKAAPEYKPSQFYDDTDPGPGPALSGRKPASDDDDGVVYDDDDFEDPDEAEEDRARDAASAEDASADGNEDDEDDGEEDDDRGGSSEQTSDLNDESEEDLDALFPDTSGKRDEPKPPPRVLRTPDATSVRRPLAAPLASDSPEQIPQATDFGPRGGRADPLRGSRPLPTLARQAGAGPQESMEFAPSERIACAACGRKFKADSLAKHEKVCASVFVSPQAVRRVSTAATGRRPGADEPAPSRAASVRGGDYGADGAARNHGAQDDGRGDERPLRAASARNRDPYDDAAARDDGPVRGTNARARGAGGRGATGRSNVDADDAGDRPVRGQTMPEDEGGEAERPIRPMFQPAVEQAGADDEDEADVVVARSTAAAFEDAVDDAATGGGARVRCGVCNRPFNADRIEKHQSACRKSAAPKKRGEFNMTKQRMPTEALSLSAKGGPARDSPSPDKRSKWKEEHESFISMVRSARNSSTEDVAKAAPAASASKPRVASASAPRRATASAASAGTGTAAAKASGPPAAASAQQKLRENSDGTVPCPHCSRSFSRQAAERHVPICANNIHKPRPPSKTNRFADTAKIRSTPLNKRPMSEKAAGAAPPIVTPTLGPVPSASRTGTLARRTSTARHA